MKKFVLTLIIIFNFNLSIARDTGETEITAADGIEVFQDEKYYLLKNNVRIESDNFTLEGNTIKILFDKDLYDIKIIDAKENVKFVSEKYNIDAEGEKINFNLEKEEINIEGKNSVLFTNDSKMYSDGFISVNSTNGNFNINGLNSLLMSENITIEGEKINGTFTTVNNSKTITMLDVYDKNIAYINNNKTEMFAQSIKYNENTSIIELEKNVKIINNGEIIIGDYGTLNTKTNSYKIKSNDSKKVKIIISDNNE